MSERTEKLRKKLAAGELASGVFICIHSPMVAEMVADTGFDWALIDTEHQPFNAETLFHMLLAFRGSDTVPIIRVHCNDEVMIKQALDMGFEGVMTPQTNTVEDVRKAVAACRYPPMGRRGFGPMRPGGYYRREQEYRSTANDQIICCIQIEDVCGAEEIDEIVKVPGLDWIMIGRYDMSGSMGKFGEVWHPELWECINRIIKTSRAANVPVGIPFAMGNAEDIKKTIDTGSQLITIGGDAAYLVSGLDTALETYSEVSKGLRWKQS